MAVSPVSRQKLGACAEDIRHSETKATAEGGAGPGGILSFHFLTQTLAVRETSVSRHHGGPIEGPSETPHTSQHYHIEGIKELIIPHLQTQFLVDDLDVPDGIHVALHVRHVVVVEGTRHVEDGVTCLGGNSTNTL